jgi:hypothetical protein
MQSNIGLRAESSGFVGGGGRFYLPWRGLSAYFGSVLRRWGWEDEMDMETAVPVS